MQAMIEGGAARCSTTSARPSLAHFDGAASGCSRDAGHRLSRSTRAWCAAWTTTTAPCSSGSPTGSARRARSCGGGRYDGLFEQLGGKPTPACGFAHGHASGCCCCCRTPAARRPAPRPTPTSCTHGEGALELRAGASPRRCATRGHAVVRARGRRQLQVADEEGRRERRALRADPRRGRSCSASEVIVKPLRDAGEQLRARPRAHAARGIRRHHCRGPRHRHGIRSRRTGTARRRSRRWWKDNGNQVRRGGRRGGDRASPAWQGWRWWQRNQAAAGRARCTRPLRQGGAGERRRRRCATRAAR